MQPAASRLTPSTPAPVAAGGAPKIPFRIRASR